MRRKIENVLFDQFWYYNREEKQRRERMRKQRQQEGKVYKVNKPIVTSYAKNLP